MFKKYIEFIMFTCIHCKETIIGWIKSKKEWVMANAPHYMLIGGIVLLSMVIAFLFGKYS